jgi:putative ABC transport system permease protein
VIAEFVNNLNGDIGMGLAQAAGAIVLCAAVVLVCSRFAVHVEREAAISVLRGLVQMVLVGMVLAGLLHGNLLVGTLILLAMTFAAAVTASRRARDIKGSLLVSFYAIAAGSSIVIAAMLATGTLAAEIAVLVPVGSMIIANAMNACAQSMERFRADVTAHVGQIEAGLALGAAPGVTVAPYVQSAVYASLLPRLDMLKSLGLVWIPGVMAGMMVDGRCGWGTQATKSTFAAGALDKRTMNPTEIRTTTNMSPVVSLPENWSTRRFEREWNVCVKL